jgi:hypothetical protein
MGYRFFYKQKEVDKLKDGETSNAEKPIKVLVTRLDENNIEMSFEFIFGMVNASYVKVKCSVVFDSTIDNTINIINHKYLNNFIRLTRLRYDRSFSRDSDFSNLYYQLLLNGIRDDRGGQYD